MQKQPCECKSSDVHVVVVPIRRLSPGLAGAAAIVSAYPARIRRDAAAGRWSSADRANRVDMDQAGMHLPDDKKEALVQVLPGITWK